MCVLVVDDEPLLRVLIAETLKDAGHDVVTAENAVVAFQTIEEHPAVFTCLVTDYRMPGGLTGADLIERMRIEYPVIPMVLATAFADSVSTAWCGKLRVQLLFKPFEPAELIEAVGGGMHT